jgi:uncharacterized protein YjbI with pentapeptide repeats
MAKFKESALSAALRDGSLSGDAQLFDLAYANLRGADLRAVNLRRANLRGAYCHSADLRGVDLSEAEIEGASFHMARVSGSYFPPTVTADELRLSLEVGTRVRCTGRPPTPHLTRVP